MSRIAGKLTVLIKNSPLFALSGDSRDRGVPGRLAAPWEYCNASGNIKKRITFEAITRAKKQGSNNKAVIIEPTGGNTGIGRTFAAVVGLPVFLDYLECPVNPWNIPGEQVYRYTGTRRRNTTAGNNHFHKPD
ncbi:MAG: hypothetical protein LBU25_02610 [Treponema sp.]|jgi:hypothetical protein|nr:hypothetical protein [Treponema sp.]